MGTLEVLIRLFSFRKKMNKYNFEWLITILYDLFQYHIKSCSKIVVFIEWSEWVKVTQWCSTLGDPMDYTIHGILQARILEWVTYHFSSGSSQPRNWTRVSWKAGGFYTNWAIREALLFIQAHTKCIWCTKATKRWYTKPGRYKYKCIKTINRQNSEKNSETL